MKPAAASLADLRALIGRQARLRGIPCRVSEVLESPPALVLTPLARRPLRQTDVHGRPWEVLGETFTLALDGDGWEDLKWIGPPGP